jgi:arylsulfatase A-like enzyme
MSVPGASPGRVSQLVSLVDLAPTLSSLTGVPGWEKWQGTDLSNVFSGDFQVDPRSIHSKFLSRWALINPEGIKVAQETNRTTLHGLVADPLETADFGPNEAALVATFAQEREQFLEECLVIRESLAE